MRLSAKAWLMIWPSSRVSLWEGSDVGVLVGSSGMCVGEAIGCVDELVVGDATEVAHATSRIRRNIVPEMILKRYFIFPLP